MKKYLLFILGIILLYSTSILMAAEKANNNKAKQSDNKENVELEKSSSLEMAPLSVRDAMEQLKVTEGVKDELIITSVDSDSGLSSSYNLKDDSWKIDFAYHVNSHPREMTDMAGIDFGLGTKIWPKTWLVGYLETATIRFRSMSESNQYWSADANELDKKYETAVLGGLGLSYESSYIQDFLSYEKFFETITASPSWIRIHEVLLNENFTGPGIRADYGVHYRFSKIMHLGLRFTYAIFSVKRPEEYVDEPEYLRHLSISWTSWGIDFAIYF